MNETPTLTKLAVSAGIAMLSALMSVIFSSASIVAHTGNGPSENAGWVTLTAIAFSFLSAWQFSRAAWRAVALVNPSSQIE